MKNELLKAIELALSGQWDAAHGIVQQYEGDPTAAWIHAVLHKIEGDLDLTIAVTGTAVPGKWTKSARSPMGNCR